MRNLRLGRIFQRTERTGVQELRVAHQFAIRGYARRMQSDSADLFRFWRRDCDSGSGLGDAGKVVSEIVWRRTLAEALPQKTQRTATENTGKREFQSFTFIKAMFVRLVY